MGKLYVVPTPIGNLKDITFRAIEILKGADFILCEDTRNSQKLLQHFDINNKLMAFHQHNEHKITESVVEKIENSTSVALITDAGTPGISDPGFLLVRACLDKAIEVETLPGATAFVPALVNSGFPCDKFYFHGFLPHKKGRQKQIEQIKNQGLTTILYESPYRLIKTLEQFKDAYGEDHKISISREISKIYEETKVGSIKEILEYFSANPIKGEFVLVVSGI